MKNFNRLLGLIFVGLASTAMFVACADSTEESCLLDTDCSAEFVCESDICVQTCATVADCPVGDKCVARPSGGSENVCVVDPTYNNTNTNNTNNTNNVTADPVYVALIKDTTTGVGCDGDNPGSDLIYVSLEADDGTVKGYGEAIYEDYLGDENVYTLGANLDGAAPNSTNTCPEFNEDNVTALGCGGAVGVRFLNNGTPVPIELDDQIRIYEFGGQCPTGTTVDAFDLVLCSDTDAVVNDTNISSCTNTLAGGEGETVITITSLF